MTSDDTPIEVTDEELLQKAGRGDLRSFEQFYDRAGGHIFSLLCQMMRDERVAAEVLRDGFASLWKQAAAYDPERCRALPWAVMHLRPQAIERMRVLGRRSRVVDSSVLDQTTPLMEAGDERLDARGSELAVALKKLPADQRQLIEQGFSRGLNYHILAESLEVPSETAKTNIHRGMLRLLELMKGAA
ncbi:MAG: sigma-70 family RNA polymerase sigma factor [Prosthecobacter sp.]